MCTTKLFPKMQNESRKIRKPLMEKKRRARINDCLEELKKMLLQNKKESLPDGRPSKLEKADILEQTVDLMKRIVDPLGGYSRGFHDSEDRTRSMIESYENMSAVEKQRLCSYLFVETRKDTALSEKRYIRSTTNCNNQSQELLWRPW